MAERLKGNRYGTLLYQRQKQLEDSLILTWLMYCISDAAERTKNERHLSLQGQKELSVVGSPSEIILQSPRLELTLSCSQWIMASRLKGRSGNPGGFNPGTALGLLNARCQTQCRVSQLSHAESVRWPGHTRRWIILLQKKTIG